MEACVLVVSCFKKQPALFDIFLYLFFEFIERTKLYFVSALLSKNNLNIFAIDFFDQSQK